MKIRRFPLQSAEKLSAFADRHDLTLEIHERRPGAGRRYYAFFSGVDVESRPGILASVYGNGSTEAEAVENYARELSGQFLVVDARKPSRREFLAPPLVAGDNYAE